MGPYGVRWLDDEPAPGGAPEWRGAGYYLHHPTDGLALVGLTHEDAVRFVGRVAAEVRRERWRAGAPTRRRRAEQFGAGVVAFLRLVAAVGPGLVSTGAAVVDSVSPRRRSGPG